MELFILVPEPHEPLVLRLDKKSTIFQVKASIERKRGWSRSQQKLRLENGRDVGDKQSLMSLRLHKQAMPTLHLLLETPATMQSRTASMLARTASVLTGAAQEAGTRAEPDADERAAVQIQSVLRGQNIRRQYEDERLWLAIRELCAHTEMRCAQNIQRRWRVHARRFAAAREEREAEAARAIQREHRSRQRRLNPKRHQAAWLREMVAEAELSLIHI